MKKTQRGVTLTGLLMTSMVVVLVAVTGMKVVPEYIEYGKIMSNMKALAQDPSVKNGSVSDVRKAFNRRADIDHIQAVTGQDLDVGKEGGVLVISVAYTKRIALFGPVSLLIDFEGSTAR
jgi:hypothetical protein